MDIGTTAAAQTSAKSSANPLASLSDNFNNFLNLLMTQLKNQDPTTPLDTNQFTSELVQFTSVQQQINTNASLGQLIQLQQGSEVIQSSATVGKTATVTSDHVPLQNGKGQINFTVPTSEPVQITISNDSGTVLQQASLTATPGANTWTWDGGTSSGTRAPDGAYKVTVEASNGGAATALPFTVTGKATGVTNTNGTVNLNLGPVSVGFGAIQSLGS